MKYFLLLIFLIIGGLATNAQQIELEYTKTPLDEVLIDIRDQYQLQFSFSNNILKTYLISVDKNFSSVEQALEFLFSDLPVTFDKIGETYLVYKTEEPIASSEYLLSGNVYEINSTEKLPYAHLNINGVSLVTSNSGHFSIQSETDSLFHIHATYLGFNILDTIVRYTRNCRIELIPHSYNLNEIKVETSNFNQALSLIGENAGEVFLSKYVTSYLPGNGDNSVFNLLRLQPGILAAGEQSSDLLIWGSYEGQSHLQFDGITLFSMKNYNDNISTVNPFLAKSVKILKGGYNVEYNGFVGGVVDISGVNGDFHKLSSQFNINNQTLNGMVTIPLFNQASLVVAGRKTYYELYDQSSVTVNIGRRRNNTVEQILYPDYNFQDLNVKLSGNWDDRTDFQINVFYGADDFLYSLDLEGTNSNFQYEETEQNKQSGWSAQWSYTSLNGANVKFLLADSKVERTIQNLQRTGKRRAMESGRNSDDLLLRINDRIFNDVYEQKFKIVTTYAQQQNHKLKWSTGFHRFETAYHEDSLRISTYDNENQIRIVNGYICDDWYLGDRVQLELGLLDEYAIELEKNYLQPRGKFSYQLSDRVRLNLSTGLYRQYLTRLTKIDDFSSIRYYWMLADGNEISIQNSVHNVFSFNYNNSGLTFNVELFHKKTNGLTRFANYSFNGEAYSGNSICTGVDMLINKQFKRMQFWAAYTFSKTNEYFGYFETNEYQRALHDQRHELKLTALFELRNWHVTSNYVYGSGFPNLIFENSERDYHRLDIAVTNTFNLRKLNIDIGLSVLNVLNYKNLKYDNFYRLPDETETISIESEALPFTPTLYLNFAL